MKSLYHPKFRKFLTKTKDQVLLELAQKYSEIIGKDPQAGKLLQHPFRKYEIRSFHFHYKKNEYRIAYTIDPKKPIIIFLLIDVRENFYKKLEKII